MNFPSNTQYEAPRDSAVAPPTSIGPARIMYWSILREIWENRSIYLAPLAAAAVFLAGFLISLIRLRQRMGSLNAQQQHEALAMPFEYAAAVVMGTAFVVGIFYTMDALYGERRDRSILFWKSLPVSDVITVLSKLVIPVFVLPLLSFAITLATQFIMLLLSTAVLAGSGVSVATVWSSSSLSFHATVGLFYHLLTIHGLWYAPLYGWMLLVSAWAPRAPIIWAVLPPFVIWAVEKIAFNTSYFLKMMEYRVIGPEFARSAMQASPPMSSMVPPTPLTFFIVPGLWIGLAVGAAFVAGAVRLRRYRGPI